MQEILSLRQEWIWLNSVCLSRWKAPYMGYFKTMAGMRMDKLCRPLASFVFMAAEARLIHAMHIGG